MRARYSRTGSCDLLPCLRSSEPVFRLKASAPDRTRTCDARFRKPTLYPLSYGGLSCKLAGQIAVALTVPLHGGYYSTGFTNIFTSLSLRGHEIVTSSGAVVWPTEKGA